ncbi:hypothetical protein BaRGS_00030873, partial [Batillaria attramentaria]
MSRVDMAADDKKPSPTPQGKVKKKSALAKLVERKKRQTSDGDSEYGSRVSLRDSGAGPPQHSSLPLEPEVIVERKSPPSGSRSPHKRMPLEGDGKPKPKPRRNSKVGQEPLSLPMEMGSSGCVEEKQDDSVDMDDASKKLPSEATIYRFRNMRMAADQNDSTDDLKKGPFVPKPPSTPRTPRNAATAKGEKRNHEPGNSSSEEVDMKRQAHAGLASPKSNRGAASPQSLAGAASPQSHAKGQHKSQDTDSSPQSYSKSQQRTPLDDDTAQTNGKKSQTEAASASPIHSLEQSPSKDMPSKLLASPAMSAGSSEARDVADETMDQLHQHYQQLMAQNKGSPYSTRPESTHSGPADSSPRSRKLDPLSVKHTPPPMDVDMTSHALRTAYKADPSYRAGSSSMLKKMSKALSDGGLGNGGASSAQLGSDNISFTSTSVMPVITTREARSRSFLVGSVSSGASSILGPEELERYFPDRRIHIFSGSWNMNELKACEYVQDIYAVGTQENEMNKREWEIRIQETLGPSHVLFHSVSYGALHLAIYIRRDLIWFCSEPEEDVVSLRAITMVKTKGAIGIAFSMFGTSFLFINCHLTSDRGSSKNAHRLLDYHRVTQELKLPHHRVSKQAHPTTKLADVTARFDCVFWCGDLNFRLERRRVAVEGTVTQMTSNDSTPHFEELLASDQLSKLITEGKIFGGFQEGRINFQPTFKFDVNTDKYDSSAKNRIPSYT